MPKTTTEITIVLSSPNDVRADRKAVMGIIAELNEVYSEREVRLIAKDWEEGAIGGVGEDGQEVLNAQLFREADIFIAMIGNRLGTPTARDVSGTAEEIMYALDNVSRLPNGMNIQVCFRTEPVVPNEDNISGIAEVLQFKKRVHAKGVLSNSYSSLESLSSHIRRSISSSVESILAGQFAVAVAPSAVSDKGKDDGGLSLEPELGILDYMDQTESSMAHATSSVGSIANLLSELGECTRDVTVKLSNENLSNANKRSIINMFSQKMTDIATSLEGEVLSASHYFADGVNNTVGALALDEFVLSDDDLGGLESSMKELLNTIEEIKSHAVSLTDSIASSPRMTKEFNVARRKLADATTQNVMFLDSAYQQLISAIDKVSEARLNRN